MLEIIKEGLNEVMDDWKLASDDRMSMIMEKVAEKFEKLIS